MTTPSDAISDYMASGASRNLDDLHHSDRDPANPNYLAAIQELLVVMAKHNSIRIPPELFPTRTRSNTTMIDPKSEDYDSSETIEYQLRQLPSQFSPQLEGWGEAFPRLPKPKVEQWDPRRPRSAVEERDLRLLRLVVEERDKFATTRLNNVLRWEIGRNPHLNGAYIDYSEFGYDRRGYVCRLVQDSAIQTNAAARESPLRSPNFPKEIDEHILFGANRWSWVGQRFGREWKLGVGWLMEDILLAIAVLQICHDTDLIRTGENGFSRRRLGNCFLTQFRDKWEPSQDLWGTSDYRWARSVEFDRSRWEDLVFQYHMRVFTTTRWQRPRLGIERLSGNLKLVDNEDMRSLSLSEMRYSVGLKTTWGLDPPVFSLVTVADNDSSLRGLEQLWNTNEWETAEIQPSICATGIAAFAFRIHSLIPQWERQWSLLIDEIEREFESILHKSLSPSRQREIMVDSSDLRLSSFYFAVIQILRIAADWIQESIDNLRQTVDDMERLYFSPTAADNFPTFLPREPREPSAAIKTFKQNWDSVMLHQQRSGTALLIRISKLQEETRTLRDSTLNTTAVNEATKSTQVNNYILVFTVVTVFYLPLSFITAFFTLEFFDWENPRQMRWFIVTIISVAGATYLFSWLWIRAVQDAAQRPIYVKAFLGFHDKAAAARDWFCNRLATVVAVGPDADRADTVTASGSGNGFDGSGREWD
ncbi:hypothetical protein OQA88_11590 [Cercophora sp. LCS_1]